MELSKQVEDLFEQSDTVVHRLFTRMLEQVRQDSNEEDGCSQAEDYPQDG
jgi:hypothetical protein